MSTIYEYKYFCETEGKWIHELRKDIDGSPTQCKNGVSHIIKTDSILISVQYQADVIYTKSYQNAITTDESIGLEDGYKLITKVNDDKSIYEKIFNYNVDIVCGSIYSADVIDGDYIDVYSTLYELVIHGQLANNITAGDNIITVNADTISEAVIGKIIKFGNILGDYRIIDIDTVNSKLTLDKVVPVDIIVGTDIKFYDKVALGVLTAQLDIGQNILSINPEIFGYLKTGVNIVLNGDKYKLIDTDEANNKITIYPIANKTYSLNTPIYICYPMVNNYYIIPNNRMIMGKEITDVSPLQKTFKMVIEYNHKETLASEKNIFFWIIYKESAV